MPKKTIYMNYYEQIDQGRVKVLMSFLTNLVAKNDPGTLYFLYSSTGGDVNAGIVLYNFLRALPVKVVMHNTGAIDSIATVVFLAGEERYAAKHSSFLLHGVTSTFPEKHTLGLTQAREIVSRMEQDQKKIAGIIGEHTKLSLDAIEKLLIQGEAKGSQFAKNEGFIDSIREPSIPKGEAILTITHNVK